MITASAWPTERASHATVVAQFGESRADLMAWALTTGDPLADALVEEMRERGLPESRALLARGLQDGLASLTDPPPALAALLSQTETRPDYATDELIDSYSLPFFTSPAPVHIVSLSTGSLVRAYQSPSIARVLTTTGRLIEGAPRRIRETGTWLLSVMLPGSLRPGGTGYQATIQVRLLHAHMRRIAVERGYEPERFGAPINQVDIGRTWMDFTLISYAAEEEFGFGLTTREQDSLYRYWWYVGHLLGLDPRLVQGVTSNEAAKRVDDLFQTVTGPVNDESAVLAEATIASTTGTLKEVLNVPAGLARPVLNAITRRIHGPALAQDLRVPAEPAADLWLTPAVAAIRSRRDRRRGKADAWAADIDRNLSGARAQLEQPGDATAYQRGATRPED